MSEVPAVSVSPTWAVPLMVGLPVAGMFGAGAVEAGPLTVSSSLVESILPSSAQTAPWAAQSVVSGRTMVTSASPSGSTVTSQPMLDGGDSRRALVTVPPLTSNASSRTVT